VNGNFWGVVPYEGKYDALGITELHYDTKEKRFSIPVYWINSALNSQEITYMKAVKTAGATNYIIMTHDGRLLKVSQ